jgi:hypothetical protein
MIVTMAWKEYREHRSIWLTMVLMTCVLGYGLAQLVETPDLNTRSLATPTLAILGLAAAYGLVCGAMMLAGEKEAGTMVFLDIFLGRRGILWGWKFVLGLVLALSEALTVALALYLLKQRVPEWLPTLVGQRREGTAFPATGGQRLELWFAVLPALTVEAFAWGFLGSALTRRVLAGAALAAVMAAPFLLITIFTPAEVFLGFRAAAVVFVLIVSCVVFMAQSREVAQGPAPRPDDRPRLRRPISEWEGGGKFDLERRAPELARRERRPLDVPMAIPDALIEPERVVRRERRPEQAHSEAGVLFWLVLRQAWMLLLILAGGGLVIGLLVPAYGQVLWPVATLLVGLACGTATFAPEQREQSYQFLGAHHLPLGKIWTTRIVFWLTAAVLLTGVLVGGGGLTLLAQAVAARRPDPQLMQRDPLDPAPFPAQGPPAAGPVGFEFGTLKELMGPPLFFGVWLVYGFCTAQVLVLFCRKNVLAVLLSALVCGGALALWLPSVLCRGMNGWQIWLPPLAMLAATWCLMRAWAGGRIKERRPLAAMTAISVAAVAWIGLNLGWRAWEIPDPGEPLDREAYRASIPVGRENAAGQKIQEALAEFNNKARDRWLALMTEAANLKAKLGVIETTVSGSPQSIEANLQTCRDLTEEIRKRAKARQAEGKSGEALRHLVQILVLSRNLRNKAPQASYRVGVEIENSALEGLDAWLAASKPRPGQLREVLRELDRHAAQTPPPEDSLQTECYRAGNLLDNPNSWAFQAGLRAPGQPSGVGLGRAITLSLDMPWEEERKIRLWRLAWAGLFQAVRTPCAQLPDPQGVIDGGTETTRRILQGWLPPAEGPGASITPADMAQLLDESWLPDERLFAPVVPLRAAATRSQWRVAASRLMVALALYQLHEGKAAPHLRALVPKYLPALPLDPYRGRDFGYRVSGGEQIEMAGGEAFQGRIGPDRGAVNPGQGVFWSTGPDRVNDGGRKHGGLPHDDEAAGPGGGCDLVTVVPNWQR